jgi:hypothetical protein
MAICVLRGCEATGIDERLEDDGARSNAYASRRSTEK